MNIRPSTEAERKYTYTLSMQLQGQTGCIGHLRGDFDRDGNSFFTSWDDHWDKWKTDEFVAELDEVINALRSDEYGLLQNRSAMSKYAAQFPESYYQGIYCTEYGFRAETEKHAFLFRCNPSPGDYNFYCYCYVKERLDHHMKEAEKGILFIDSSYNDLFRIADGEMISITDAAGKKSECVCHYIDEYHVEVDNNLYHIGQFAQIMERSGSIYAPVESGTRQAEEEEPEEKTEQTLEYKTWFGTTDQVTLTVSTYMDNDSLYVGLTKEEDGFSEFYADVTVNLSTPVPPYCAFVDTNNRPEVEEFLVKNEIAQSMGLEQISGYCKYPLYMFNEQKLREFCPNEVAIYEQKNKLNKDQDKKRTEKSR